jgi:hypothetical protein
VKANSNQSAAPAVQPPQPGTVAWLDHWAGHARAGARMVVGPVEATGDLLPEFGQRCRALVGRGIIVAVWARVRTPAGMAWEWHICRTVAALPAGWPVLRAVPGQVR